MASPFRRRGKGRSQLPAMSHVAEIGDVGIAPFGRALAVVHLTD